MKAQLVCSILIALASLSIAAPSAAAAEAPKHCQLVAQDLDYAHYVCVDATDSKCVVATMTVSGGQTNKTCYGVQKAATTTAWDGCVQYAYVADYHWYWACVDTKNTSCPVYFKEQHGVTVTKRCVVG